MIRNFIPGAGAWVVLALVGCGQGSNSPPKPNPAKAEHGHKPGTHGGLIVAIGKDNYHAEAIFEGGNLRLYTLGKDESQVKEIDAQPVSAFARAMGDRASQPFVLRPEPQPADRPGQTSLFVGQLPAALVGKHVEVIIPSISIGDQRFRVAFQSKPAEHAVMPSSVEGEEEKLLYLTPGGKYTQDDIRANGSMTAPQKFKGMQARHDLKPKAGDKICPITLTKANPQFSWIVDGKTYEFCCPPCVDEFVAQAKTMPTDLKPPEHYVKK